MNRYFVSAGVALVLALAVPQGAGAEPGNADPSITDGSAAKALSVAKKKWRTSGFRNYRFDIVPSCFCPFTGKTHVTVRGRKVKTSNPEFFGPKTVPALFKFVKDAIDRKVFRLDVTYSKSRGVPLTVSTDSIELAVDEEIAYTVTKFRKIKKK